MSDLSNTLAVNPAAEGTARVIFRWLTFPALFALGLVGVAAITLGSLPAMPVQFGIFLLTVAAVAAAERYLPFQSRWSEPSKIERRVDLTSWAVVMAIVDPFVGLALMPLLLGLFVALVSPAGLAPVFPSELALPAQLVVAALIAEFGQYWMHRAAHAVSPMWRIHGFHHSPARIYWMNGFRVNPINLVWHKLSGVFVLMLIGTPVEVMQSYIILSTVVSVVQHANADLRFDGWNLVLATPDLHRWHHSADLGEAKSNFGSFLITWDQVFGTYRNSRFRAPNALGIKAYAPSGRGYLGELFHSMRNLRI